MGLDALLARLAGGGAAVTPVTPPLPVDVTAKPAPMLACTSVTPVTPPGSVTAGDARSRRWALHFADAEPLTVTFDPVASHADALARYPHAVAAEPLPEPTPTALPDDTDERVAQCVQAGLYGDEDRPALAAMHAADELSFHRLIAEMHARIGRCYGCKHFARPGLSDGYCASRADLPHAYGFMHFLPEGKGATCDSFKEAP
jgi:hypothetical protein